MTNVNRPKTDETAQDSPQKDIKNKKKKLVDVATLEESVATSETDPENSAPVAAGEASG